MMNNLCAGWISIFAGCVAGGVAGLFIHREDWLGGYGSWPRRMLRLAHISFFGIGIMNLAFGPLTWTAGPAWPGWLLIGAAGAMPATCYLAAFRPRLRHLFAIPVAGVLAATGDLIWRVMR